jgi:hypothetical protein
MRSVFCIATTLLAAASTYAQNSFTVNTPANAVVCQPVLVSWQGGQSPYYLSVLPGNTPSGQALENLGTFNGTTFTWTVNIAAGTSIDLTVRDSSGQTAQTAPFTINAGSDSSCVGKAVSGSAGTGTAAAATSAGGATATSGSGSGTGGGTGAATGGGAGSTATSGAGGSSASSTSTSTSGSSSKSNAASPANVAKVGVAGVAGAILAAFLA